MLNFAAIQAALILAFIGKIGMLTSLKRIFIWGGQSFARNSGASFATTMVMIIVICLITSLFLLQKITKFSIAALEEKIALTVFFKEDSPEEENLAAKRELSFLPAIEKVEYISKEEALEIFSGHHRENPIIMESLAMVGENPLLSYLNIKTKEPSQYEAVSDFLNKASFAGRIDHINYSQLSPVIKKTEEITTGLTSLGIILSIVFGIIAVLVAFNTVKLAILNLKEEISIMRLVGASNFFIRGPLIIQGAISGILATIVSLIIFTLLTFFLGPKLEVFLPGLNLFGYFMTNLFQIALIQLATGIGLGIVSSTIATRRYLRV